MKTPLFVISILLMFCACKKNGEHERRLPAPDCGDASDEGKFERWNAAQMDSVPVYSHVPGSNGYLPAIPNEEIAGYVEDITLDQKSDSSNLLVSYIPKKPIQFFARFYHKFTGLNPLQNSGFIQDQLGVRRIDTVYCPRNFYPRGSCGRLYYYVLDSTGRVVTKGHFDIEL